ncbi:MAG: orotidine-5'-phosphate decarboxylase [Bacteroidia bacterium]
MTKQELFENIRKKKSFLCVGLDPDLTKIPKHLLKTSDPIFEFNKAIIDATQHVAVAFKPNMAFYEAYGVKGWESLQKTIDYINANYKNIFTIADAKRGDIGNTSGMYAKTFFSQLNFDSLTVAPYMGSDSVKPFLEYPSKWVILLALTSNKGAEDFQLNENLKTKNENYFFEEVLKTSVKWGTSDNMMYVVGATQATMLQKVREIIPEHFLLIPGVGAQGGSLADVAKYGMNKYCGLLVNSSRGIIYASNDESFAEKAKIEAEKIQQEMQILLEEISV